MSDITPDFQSLGLAAPIVKAISELGYEVPSPIQAESIPVLLQGRDIIGQAQTGTGKTAAFALPMLTNLDMSKKHVQLLVLAPTRELAIQVAEAFQSYSRHIKNFHVAPIYGGSSYDTQLRLLRRGVQVVVGTPGRVMDHIRKGTLKLDNLSSLVLDEADEMLRMGFIDDVEWVLEQTPSSRQIALFSATMPKEIRKVAQKHLNEPVEIKVKAKTETSENIRQRYWITSGMHKLDALTRFLEAEEFDGVIIFVRTKTATVELAEKLNARGLASAALNGDISQSIRERTVDRLKSGSLDIVIATDVAARGIDVKRVSHVINYDIPYDTESYVHRIGRTGRAGRTGDAILFVAPRERRLLKAIERMTKQPIEAMTMPSATDINTQRIERFKQQITKTLDSENLDLFLQIIQDYQADNEVDPVKVAAAVAFISQGKTPLLLNENEKPQKATFSESDDKERRPRRERKNNKESRNENIKRETYALAVGYKHGVKPGNIVGAIANEANIESQYIGSIEIFDDFSKVDLPMGMPQEVFKHLKNTSIAGRKINIALFNPGEFNEEKNHRPTEKTRNENSRRRPNRRRNERRS